MRREHRVSVIIPAYNEEETIAAVVADYVQIPEVDEVLVVDNNCKDRTAELAAEAGARVVSESAPGYGRALTCGMRNATGDILVLTEADGSFKGSDVEKLLVYLDDADMVCGTRTTRQMVQQAANMGRLLRMGNLTMAKYLELLWFFPTSRASPTWAARIERSGARPSKSSRILSARRVPLSARDDVRSAHEAPPLRRGARELSPPTRRRIQAFGEFPEGLQDRLGDVEDHHPQATLRQLIDAFPVHHLAGLLGLRFSPLSGRG
jgi:glycosyltransferase involved in cell wall biosynthesis